MKLKLTNFKKAFKNYSLKVFNVEHRVHLNFFF